MTEVAVEEIDPESWLTREVYANYGLAMYMAQVLESGLVNLAVWTGIRDQEYSIYADAEADLVALFRKTMGAQRHELLARRPDLAHIEDLLGRALKLRNFLAHNYFRVRAAAFVSEDGQHRLIEELKGAREFFAQVDANMTILVREIMRLKGLEGSIDEVMEEVRQQGFGEPLPGL